VTPEPILAADDNVLPSVASFSTLLEAMPDGIVMADSAGLIILATSQAEQLFGYSSGELHGQPIEILLPARLRQAHVAHRSNFFAQPRVRSMGAGLELNGVRKDGTEFAVEISLSPIQTDAGTLVISAIRDISERKRIARMLSEKNIELQAAAQAKDRFLANMSHELRSPLNGIIGFAELMHNGKLGAMSEPHHEYIGDILASARHLLHLISDVLDLAKLGAGRVDLHAESLDLPGLVGEVCNGVRPIAAQKHISIEIEVAPELRGIVGDGTKIKQILHNYLSNAIKFSGDAGRIWIRCLAAGDAHFRIEVEDTGIGIAAGDLARLFVEFQQLDASAAKRYQGTGLGLALSKRLCEVHGGRIEVRSEPGKGSVFSAILPRVLQLPDAPAPGPSADPQRTPILVLADAFDKARYLGELLAGAGYEVVNAANGAQAIEFARRRRFAAMTLDLSLTEFNRAEVLRDIRATPLNRYINAIVVSVIGERSVGKGMGITDLLQKPVDPERLLESLQRLGGREHFHSVLVVDDDHAALDISKIVLEGAGYRVVCAGNPLVALDFLKTEPFDAFVIDLMMPQMTGFELIERIRALPRTRLKPVIVWSAKDLSSEECRRLQQHANMRVGERAGGPSTLIEELRLIVAAQQTSTPIEESCRVG